MKIGLFASKEVGYKIAKFLGENNPPVFLVLDSNEDPTMNANIIDASRVDIDDVHFSNDFTGKDSLKSIRDTAPDLIILAWWGHIIKKEVIDIPKIGVLNTHYSCLPYHRGKHGNFWTFVDDAPFGATIHWVNEDIDAGDIAFQVEIPKTWEDTGGTLYRKVQDAMVRLFIDNFPAIQSGNIPRRSQLMWSDIIHPSYHNSKEIEAASEIRLGKLYHGDQLLNLIRARTFPGQPAAWFTWGGEKYEVRIEIKKVKK